MTEKTQLREIMKLKRQLASGIMQLFSAYLSLSEEKFSLFSEFDQVACYWPKGSEFDVTGFLVALTEQYKKNCYLPVVSSNPSDKLMKFARYQLGDPLVANQFGIKEPVNREHLIDPTELDAVLLPLLAFDPKGNRLGMGAGYYDHTFRFRKNPASHGKPLLIGVGYSFQEVNEVPHDPWDVQLDLIFTERGIICANPQGTIQ